MSWVPDQLHIHHAQQIGYLIDVLRQEKEKHIKRVEKSETKLKTKMKRNKKELKAHINGIVKQAFGR